MNRYALIGHPLGHSMSPLIHERLFKLSGISDFSYELVDIAPENLSSSEELIKSFKGLNVTIPHKQTVIPFMNKLGESAERYNSVNCINNDNGNLTGYNTDCDGFLMSAEKLPISENVVVAGCGGVGRMIAINATPVGMYPKVDNCAISDSIIEKSTSFFDVIYNPTETLLMKKAREQGKTAVGGASMLVYQAVKAHEIWYGGKFRTEDIDGIIKAVEDSVNAMNK